MGVQGDCTTTRATSFEELHAGHPGVALMKGLARTTVWWPGLGTSNAKSKVGLVVKKQGTHYQKLHCIPGIGLISRG